MKLNKSERTGVFIDGANHWHALQANNLRMDWAIVKEQIAENCTLISLRYYTGVLKENQDNPVQKLVDWLSYNGYLTVTKFARLVDEDKLKANMDIEIAVDMMILAPRLDHIILFTGDGDFVRVVEAVQLLGCKVTVVSTPNACADILKRVADEFVDLQDITKPYDED